MIRLAVAASDALIVDVDKQRSATSWWRSREVEMPALATATTSGVEEAIGHHQARNSPTDEPMIMAGQADSEAKLHYSVEMINYRQCTLFPTTAKPLRALSAYSRSPVKSFGVFQNRNRYAARKAA